MSESPKVLTIDARSRKETDVALPFTTDGEVVAAWHWLVRSGRLMDFDYRPDSEGTDAERGRVARYLAAPAEERPDIDAAAARAMICCLFGAELQYGIREVIDTSANAL